MPNYCYARMLEKRRVKNVNRIVAELREAQLHYSTWMDLGRAAVRCALNPPSTSDIFLNFELPARNALRRMLREIEHDPEVLTEFRNAVWDELKDRNLIDERGRLCS